MKKNYFFFLIFIIYSQSYGQSTCTDAYSDIIYAYSHVKSAYNANNVTHLKHYSQRSLEAFGRAKEKLNACKCVNAYNYAYDAFEMLSKVTNSKTFEDGRFYVKRVRDIAKETINELELCTELSDEDQALSELQHEQFKLKQQQIELKLKEEQIKLQLAERDEKELMLLKEQFISKNEAAIASNIKAYNEVLSSCECDSEITTVTLNKTELLSTNMEQIKIHYLNIIKDLASNYLTKLNQCGTR